MSEAVRNYITGLKDKKSKGLELPSVLVRWIVLDGVMHPIWTESTNTLFDDENKLSMANAGSVDLKGMLLSFLSLRYYRWKTLLFPFY